MRKDQQAGADQAPPAGGAKILTFRRPTLSVPRRPPPISDPLRRFDADEDRHRMRQNVAAALVVILLVMTGLWLIDQLRTSARIATCLEAGHHNCLPLNVEHGSAAMSAPRCGPCNALGSMGGEPVQRRHSDGGVGSILAREALAARARRMTRCVG